MKSNAFGLPHTEVNVACASSEDTVREIEYQILQMIEPRNAGLYTLTHTSH
jgi:hypothetical protein